MRKKMIFAGFLAILSIAACQKEADTLPVDEGKTTLRFGISDATKTLHTGAVGMLWADEDDIAVDTPTGFKTFALTDGAGTADGTFQINQTVTVNENATSVYPASLAPAWVDDKLTMTLPSSYDWSKGAVKAPMIAWLNNLYPYFHLLGGVVKVDVFGVPASATKLVVTTDNQNISGTFAMQDNSVVTSAGTNNTLTLNFTAGAASNMTFFVPLPVGTYTNITFSVQSAAETFKTVKASSLAVAKDQLVFAPALTFGAAAKETLADTAMDCSIWENWNQKDGLNTSVLEVGGRLRFNVTEGAAAGYWQLKPSYAGAGWSWTPINPIGPYNTYGLTSGQTAFDIPLTETVVTNMKERKSIVVQGFNVMVNSIEYIPAVETVLWEGEHDLGNWDNNFDVQGLNTAGFWSGLKAGKELSVYFYESDLPAIDYCQFFVKKKSGYTDISGLKFDAGTNLYQTVYSYTLTADQVSAIKDSGIVICGTKITITKITLR